MKELTKIEELLILAIWQLKDEAYGVKIRKHVSQILGKELSYGNLYSVLHQLSSKSYVLKTKSGLSQERGGKPRVYYRISKHGLKALAESREFYEKMLHHLPENALDVIDPSP